MPSNLSRSIGLFWAVVNKPQLTRERSPLCSTSMRTSSRLGLHQAQEISHLLIFARFRTGDTCGRTSRVDFEEHCGDIKRP